MGCIQSSEKDPPPAPMKDPEPPKKVDPRLPWPTYRQLFNFKNSWKAVSRSLESTAKETLMLFFRAHPEHKALHSSLAAMEDEEKMLNSTKFEEAALDVFNIFDETMECIDKVEIAMSCLQNAGRSHAKIPGFHIEYLKDMERPFLQAVKLTLGDRFTDPTEENFKLFYGFVVDQMTIGFNEAGGKKGSESNQL